MTTAKHHLPNYGVFDEYRYFVPGNRLPVVRVPVRRAARWTCHRRLGRTGAPGPVATAV